MGYLRETLDDLTLFIERLMFAIGHFRKTLDSFWKTRAYPTLPVDHVARSSKPPSPLVDDAGRPNLDAGASSYNPAP